MKKEKVLVLVSTTNRHKTQHEISTPNNLFGEQMIEIQTIVWDKSGEDWVKDKMYEIIVPFDKVYEYLSSQKPV